MKALRKFTDAELDLIDQLVSRQEIRTGRSDRAVAILITIQVEDALRRALVRWLRSLTRDEYDNLFGIMQPLSSFSAKIRLCYAMGIIGSQTRDELDLMRTIRNAFAHSGRELTFGTYEVKSACAFFKSATWLKGQPKRRGRKIPGRDAREQYHAAAKNLILALELGDVPPRGPEWTWMP